jgi:hypothetical protein
MIEHYGREPEDDYECKRFKDNNEFVQVKHGMWIKQRPNPEAMKAFHELGIGTSMSEDSIHWLCSRCGMWGTPTMKYCNNCGAKMDGGTNDEP